MANLNDVQHPDLTPYVLKILQQNNIKNVSEFAATPVHNLASIMNLPVANVQQIKQYIFEEFGPKVETMHDYLKRTEADTFILKTGIQSVDDILEEGICSGQVVEICGPATTGKSMLLNTIAIHGALQHQMRTLFISTKNSFSGYRIYSMLKAMGCDQVNCGDVMHRIHNENVREMSGLVELLRSLISTLDQDQFQMVVVDSLAPLFYLYTGEHITKGIQLLRESMTLLIDLAKRFRTVVFIKSVILGDGLNQDFKNGQIVSMVSRYWPKGRAGPATRWYLANEKSKHKDSTDTLNRKHLRIIQSLSSPGNGCFIQLTTRGME